MGTNARALKQDVSPITPISRKGAPGKTGEVRGKTETSLRGVPMEQRSVRDTSYPFLLLERLFKRTSRPHPPVKSKNELYLTASCELKLVPSGNPKTAGNDLDFKILKASAALLLHYFSFPSSSTLGEHQIP